MNQILNPFLIKITIYNGKCLLRLKHQKLEKNLQSIKSFHFVKFILADHFVFLTPLSHVGSFLHLFVKLFHCLQLTVTLSKESTAQYTTTYKQILQSKLPYLSYQYLTGIQSKQFDLDVLGVHMGMVIFDPQGC